MRTLIDTRIWVLALKRAVYPEGSPERDLGEKAQALVRRVSVEADLRFSPQLVAEIYAVSVGRGRRLRPGVVTRYLETVLAVSRVRFEGITPEQVRWAMASSREAGVHIWDFLVVAPFRHRLDRLLTMDPHFRHPAFADCGRVDNPLGVWKVEGAR